MFQNNLQFLRGFDGWKGGFDQVDVKNKKNSVVQVWQPSISFF